MVASEIQRKHRQLGTVHTFDALGPNKIRGLVSRVFHTWPGNAQLLHNAMEQSLDVCFRDPIRGPWTISQCWVPVAHQPKQKAREQDRHHPGGHI